MSISVMNNNLTVTEVNNTGVIFSRSGANIFMASVQLSQYFSELVLTVNGWTKGPLSVTLICFGSNDTNHGDPKSVRRITSFNNSTPSSPYTALIRVPYAANYLVAIYSQDGIAYVEVLNPAPTAINTLPANSRLLIIPFLGITDSSVAGTTLTVNGTVLNQWNPVSISLTQVDCSTWTTLPTESVAVLPPPASSSPTTAPPAIPIEGTITSTITWDPDTGNGLYGYSWTATFTGLAPSSCYIFEASAANEGSVSLPVQVP